MGDIEKLVKDAEKYKTEDDALRKKVESKNTYENYIYTTRQTLSEEKLKDKFSAEEKTTIEELVKTHQEYYDSHPDASAEEYDAKVKEMEGVFQPIMTKIYQSMGGQEGGMPGGMPGGMGGMPGGMGGMPGGMPGNMPQQGPNTNVEDLD